MAKKIPMRQCVGCGLMKNKKELIRIIKSPEGEIIADRTGRQNGRGAYICDNAECLSKARKNRGLERAFRQQIPETIYDSLSKELNADDK